MSRRKHPKNKKTYARYLVLPIQEVLGYIRDPRDKVGLGGGLVNACSLRLQTFDQDGTVCRACGLEGEFFALERHVKEPNNPYHLNSKLLHVRSRAYG